LSRETKIGKLTDLANT